MSTFDGGSGPDTETLLRRVVEIIESTRTLPLSSSVKLDNRDEVLEMLDDALRRMPDEFRQARWMLKERDEYLDKMTREGEDIIEAAQAEAARMVQRTEIVREAQHSARRVLEDARDEARRLRLEAEDYCDQKLASFEIVLERTIKTVAAGRAKLSATPATPATADVGGTDRPGAGLAPGGSDDETLGGDAFFDQDRGF